MTKQIRPQKRPKNRCEGLLFDELLSDGWTITKRGWPDFACWHPEKGFIVVEVKPKHRKRLKLEQNRLLKELARQGVKVYRWAPQGGFRQIIHDSDKQPHTTIVGMK